MKEHELRKRIKREKIQEQMPESTRKRMDDLLDGLPEETKRSKIHRIWKNAVVFVAVLSLSTVTVFAGVKLITLGTGKLDTKHGSRQYQRSVKLNEIQKNNAKAGISRTDQGITLRIDNVGLDEGNLLLYYTVSLNKTTTAEKLEKVKKDSLQERWNLNSIWLGPQMSIDGKANDEVNETGVTEAYRINNHKIKGVYRFNLTGKLKKKVKLDIKTNYLWDTKGDWFMQLERERRGAVQDGYAHMAAFGHIGFAAQSDIACVQRQSGLALRINVRIHGVAGVRIQELRQQRRQPCAHSRAARRAIQPAPVLGALKKVEVVIALIFDLRCQQHVVYRVFHLVHIMLVVGEQPVHTLVYQYPEVGGAQLVIVMRRVEPVAAGEVLVVLAHVDAAAHMLPLAFVHLERVAYRVDVDLFAGRAVYVQVALQRGK